MKDLLPNIHPGRILLEEFLQPLGISQYRLAKDIGVPQTRISQIVKGRRSITSDTAARLGRYFRTTVQFWLNLQIQYDVRAMERNPQEDIEAIEPVGS